MLAGKWQVKVCGMRVPEQIQALVTLPVDWMGIILVPESPRFAGKEKKLGDWLLNHQDLFGRIKKTGVFVNEPLENVLHAVQDYGLDAVQLHGDESAAYCRELLTLCEVARLPKPVLLKAIGIAKSSDLPLPADPLQEIIDYWLFDTKGPARGGNGIRFDWSVLENYRDGKPFFLSGGIGPESIEALLGFNHPLMHGIDINSRFETEAGIKDITLIQSFLEELNNKMLDL